MFILVDCLTLAIYAKFNTYKALTDLAWLELPHRPILITGCDNAINFDCFTDYELFLMYKKLTNASLNNLSRNALLSLLKICIDQLPIANIKADELAMQSNKITEAYTIFKYMRGLQNAQEQEDLFTRPALTIARNVSLEEAARLAEPVSQAVALAEPVKRSILKVVTDFRNVEPLQHIQPWLR